MNKITLTIFTDPMMGLSYESEPVIRRLETHFGNTLDIHYAMCVHVGDVRHWMIPEDIAETPEQTLISPIEISHAFNFVTAEEVKQFIQPLIDNGEIRIYEVPHGLFIEKNEEIKIY
ncbi:MAG: hypothetical protein IJ534_07400 [Bacteroidaceae bacterium]|nr:hypothetical protein [Bacteroidaceae bacterium]